MLSFEDFPRSESAADTNVIKVLISRMNYIVKVEIIQPNLRGEVLVLLPAEQED